MSGHESRAGRAAPQEHYGSGAPGQASRPVVVGEVVLPPDAPPIEGATLRVDLLKVGMADHPSEPVSRTVIANVSSKPGDNRLPFTLTAESGLDEDASYIVFSHVDLSGSGEITPGDFISTVSQPVHPGPQPERLEVQVTAV